MRRAYDDIEVALGEHGFRRVQGSVFLSDHSNLAKLSAAMMSLKALPWFSQAVRDIRGFKVEDWSDFTPLFKDTR